MHGEINYENGNESRAISTGIEIPHHHWRNPAQNKVYQEFGKHSVDQLKMDD